MVSTLLPVMCVCGVCGVSRVVCVVWVGGGKGGMVKGKVGEGGGGIDNGGWVVGPMCCYVFHIGCPKYTAKPMGRIVAK